jgi:hypothetical protein
MREVFPPNAGGEPTVNGMSPLKLIALMHSLKAPLKLPEIIFAERVREAVRIPERITQAHRDRPLPEEEPTHPELSCAPCEA